MARSPLRDGVLVTAEHTHALVNRHVPQVGADLLGHADAVAVVVHAADRGEVGHAEVVLDHLGVALEAAACQNDALCRLDAQGLAVMLHDDARHAMLLAVKDKRTGRRLKPDLNALLGLHGLLGALVEEAVARANMGGHGVDGLAARQLGVLGSAIGAQGAQDLHRRVIRVPAGLGLEEVAHDNPVGCAHALEYLGNLGKPVDKRLEHALVLVKLPAEGLVVRKHGVLVG